MKELRDRRMYTTHYGMEILPACAWGSKEKLT